MRNDSVLYRILHVAHDAKCFSPCVYFHLRQQLSDNFNPSQKLPTNGPYEYKEEGRAPGKIENKDLLRLICKLS